MKKNCVIFFNCQGGQIMNNLKLSNIFNENYNIEIIALYDYIEGYKYENNTDLIKTHKDLIKNCDLIILQHIKKNRKIIHHEYIKTLLKKDCILIKIPHYSFSGYFYPFNIINDNFINENKNKDELNNYINNLFKNNKNDILNHLENELNHIKELDGISDINCYDFIKNNYNKNLLFYSRSYPTYHFFNYISQNILNILNINETLKPLWSSYANHSLEPIYNYVKIYLNLEFEINKFNYNANIIEYLLICKKNNVNNILLNNRHNGKIYSKQILDLIHSKKYN